MNQINVNATIGEAIEAYCEHGFGSMNKNDFEVFIFSHLLQMENYKGKSNYELSLQLRIPETKIKRLRYEAALRYPDPDNDYKTQVYELLKNAQLREAGKKIAFQVEDVILKSYISSILKQKGRIIDFSFNRELVVLHSEDFEYLAEEVYPKGEYDEIHKRVQKLQSQNGSNKITWKVVFEKIFEGAAKGTVSAVAANLTRMGLMDLIAKYFV